MPRAKTSDEPREFERLLPFEGGCNTAVEPGVIGFGKYSRVQNMRPRHKGYEQRGGCLALHTVADATNKVVSLFQFTKALVDETHLFAQMNDGDVLEATNIPPTITTGAFGSEAYSGTGTNEVPASWGVVDDIMLYSNGVDQHQIFPGNSVPVDQFVVYKGSETLPRLAEVGEDYTTEVRDTSSLSYGSLDSLSNTNHCFVIRCRFIPKSFTLELSSFNSNASALTLSYWNGSWVDFASVDGTSVGGVTLAQNGTITFTVPADVIPNYLYGVMGFWFKFKVSASLDADVKVTKITYNAGWQSLINIWDSIPVQAAEVQVFINASGIYNTFSGDNVDISGMVAADSMYILSADPIEGLYIESGDSPSTTAGVTINAVYGYTGNGWTTVGTVSDYSTGATRTGWAIFPRLAVLPTQFGKNKSYGYWYKVTFSGTISADTYISISCMPYFDINEIGRSGNCNIAWKGRAVYTFGEDELFVSANGEPMVLNGDDFSILEPGDGKKNKVVAMALWYNELMAVQEEKAGKGGITLFEGYSPQTFGKIGVSDSLGVFNSKCLAIVDGIKVSTMTEEKVKKLAFGLCSKGIWRYDGTTPQIVSDEIRNYFDSNKPECIRRGYENEHWLAYDPADNVLLIGIVSGTIATSPNVFMVYDLTETKDPWSFDVRAQPFACMLNIESSSGNIRNIQIAGGTADGTIYRINTGRDDLTTAIDAYITMELDGDGEIIELRKMVLRRKAGEGTCTVIPVIDGVELENFQA